MASFQIVRAGDRFNDIVQGGEIVARVINGDDGWKAYRVTKTDRVNAMGPVYEVIGEGVKANKLINLTDGADRIAVALGL